MADDTAGHNNHKARGGIQRSPLQDEKRGRALLRRVEKPVPLSGQDRRDSALRRREDMSAGRGDCGAAQHRHQSSARQRRGPSSAGTKRRHSACQHQSRSSVTGAHRHAAATDRRPAVLIDHSHRYYNRLFSEPPTSSRGRHMYC